jgi:hypothetical protein
VGLIGLVMSHMGASESAKIDENFGGGLRKNLGGHRKKLAGAFM